MSVGLTVYKHAAGDNGTILTSKLVNFQYGRSRDIGSSESLTVSLKMTVIEATYYVRPGNWLVLWSPQGYALTFGYVVDVSSGVSRNGVGELTSGTTTVSCISWFELLRRAHLYVPRGDTIRSVGSIFSLDEWMDKITASVADELTQGNIGWSLAYLLKNLARIQLPEAMGGEFIGDAIRVVYDSVTGQAYAPNRVIEEVARTGLLPSAFTAGPMQSGIGELLQSVFYPDRHLIEMFSSLEAGGTGKFPEAENKPVANSSLNQIAKTRREIEDANNPFVLRQPETEAYDPFEKFADPANAPKEKTRELHSGDSKLAKFLGRRPVLIYRTPPWRVRPLVKSAISRMDFKATNDAVVDSITPLSQMSSLDDSEAGIYWHKTRTTPWTGLVESIKQTRADIAAKNNPLIWQPKEDTNDEGSAALGSHLWLLEVLYSEQTWKYGRAIQILDTLVRSMNITWSDSNRVNVTTIGISSSSGSSIEASESAGLPITIDESINNFGPRVARPVWPFTRSYASVAERVGSEVPIEAYLRSLAAQLMQFQINAHLMGSGTLSLNMTDAYDSVVADSVLELPAGEIFGFDIHESTQTFFAYIDQVIHRWERTSDGKSTASSQITFSRGLFGTEEDVIRDPRIPIPEAPTLKPEKKNTAPEKKSDKLPTSTKVKCQMTPGKIQSTDAVRTTNLLVGGEERPAGFSLVRKILPTKAADEKYDRAKAARDEGFYSSYRTGTINNAVVHYNVGSYYSNNEKLWSWFSDFYRGLRGAYARGSHFGIDTDGTVMQFLDCRNYANHVLFPGVNCASVGIDLINPFLSGSAAATVASSGQPSRWPILSGWKILSPTGGVLSTVDDFFGPTLAQQMALQKLLLALGTHVGVNVRHDPGTTTPRAFQRMTPTQVRAALTEGGVWHHAQLEGNRADSLGTDISAVIAGVFNQEGVG